MARYLYVVAGEHSGDAHGAGLLESLAKQVDDLKVRGVGGAQMSEITGGGVRDWVEDAAVMGVVEVLKRYGWFKEQFHKMLQEVREMKPEVLLLIDYPGFNLRFAKAVRAALPNIRIVYYVSPQVWAWNKRRIPKMAKLLDQMICLFPFEVELYENSGLKSTFVGHPLVDELEEKREDVHRDELLVGLFPGSREREVASLLPMMLEAAKRLRDKRSDLRFEVPAASEKLATQIHNLIEEAEVDDWVEVTIGQSHSLMQRACCGVLASGTATLEAAYYGLPYCLVYKVAPVTYCIAKLVVKIEFIGIVNILAKEKVVEEFIQGDASPENVGECMWELLDDPAKRESMQLKLAETSKLLGEPGSHARVADVVAESFLNCPPQDLAENEIFKP